MSGSKSPTPDSDERYSTLLNNATAVRAICSAVESTLGPKGLDTMLVGAQGEVIITNDGVTILDMMDVTHPAARLLIQVAKSQQKAIGDGTTTATVLASTLVQEAVDQVIRGVPVAKVIQGLTDGIRFAIQRFRANSRIVNDTMDAHLQHIAHTAGREQSDIAELVIIAAQRLGIDKLKESTFRFADCIISHEQAINEVWPGIMIHHKPLQFHTQSDVHSNRILVILDAFEPEHVNEEALVTEAGFQRHVLFQQQFQQDLQKLAKLKVGLIIVDRSIDAEAEQYCADQGIIVVQRVTRKEMHAICSYSGAKPIRKNGLHKSEVELETMLGQCDTIMYDPDVERIRLSGSQQHPQVTIIVGATTKEVVGERARIAKDAAAAVQAAIRGGFLPGGGSAEFAVARELDEYRMNIKGMEGFGIDVVAKALRKPLIQIVTNAGYNPLEKSEEVKSAQMVNDSDAIGIDCETGQLADFIKSGILDPTDVKIHALTAAGEVATAIMRIHTVIKMKSKTQE